MLLSLLLVPTMKLQIRVCVNINARATVGPQVLVGVDEARRRSRLGMRSVPRPPRCLEFSAQI